MGLGTIRGKRVALAQPQTFMNLSGPAVKGLLERYGLGPDRLLLVYDELAIPWQELRIRPKGSAAGHNGVKSVIGSLGTQEFARVRLGFAPWMKPGPPFQSGMEQVSCSRRLGGRRSRKWKRWSGEEPRLSNP